MQIAVSECLPRFEPGTFSLLADTFSQRLFERRFFRLTAVFFLKKNHKDLGVVLLVLTD